MLTSFSLSLTTHLLKALILDRTLVGECTAATTLDVLKKNDSILFISIQNTLIPEPVIFQIESMLRDRRSALDPVLFLPFESQIRIQDLKYQINSLSHQIASLKNKPLFFHLILQLQRA